ncbi:MAG: hypothetical protein GC182_08960 [Rhodopseudomonas sp.]|nr:hypothetical protein [Rhodopseudomonas sp.]
MRGDFSYEPKPKPMTQADGTVPPAERQQLAYTSLVIARAPNGGFIVSEPPSHMRFSETLYAATDIDDALGFIKDQIVEPEEEPEPLTPEQQFMAGTQWTDEQAAKMRGSNGSEPMPINTVAAAKNVLGAMVHIGVPIMPGPIQPGQLEQLLAEGDRLRNELEAAIKVRNENADRLDLTMHGGWPNTLFTQQAAEADKTEGRP